MLLFGHIGIAAGVVKTYEILGSVSRPLVYKSDSGSRFSITIRSKPLFRQLNNIRGRVGSIDYRLVLPGSLLPDIFN